ncbi:uncharacterized protein [Halyomorpha halys]|uniref:uncharacterized protein isoform X2 n=1 Tax=Halyomorpha halys TaxID=286706 RepID=UPI0034D2DEAC
MDVENQCEEEQCESVSKQCMFEKSDSDRVYLKVLIDISSGSEADRDPVFVKNCLLKSMTNNFGQSQNILFFLQVRCFGQSSHPQGQSTTKQLLLHAILPRSKQQFGIFKYKGDIYRQLFGVSNGESLSISFAGLVMNNLIKDVLSKSDWLKN